MLHTTYVVNQKWDYETIDVETAFLYALLEEQICMNIPEGMAYVIGEEYTYKDILTLIKYILGLTQAIHQNNDSKSGVQTLQD